MTCSLPTAILAGGHHAPSLPLHEFGFAYLGESLPLRRELGRADGTRRGLLDIKAGGTGISTKAGRGVAGHGKD
jgi:hypothetical protein